ncbi:efflux RND transporter permease subunit [Guyparkeria hydrothermalis]|uniref:efflux RND transporter permease subunit n=1 Tax=Guyparkeria TaxID=2035712 RepID=UPI0010ADA4F1|nr:MULTISPECIES: efflux RND transporter permease subunit [Guyparkeria]MCL7751142.1 efflux RND transporter permease subunit [Guyparkeria hydrothermalis]TKA88498.1 efflux RND transporter permease subunit [Guyparkeria sp. SB14A]
MSQSVVSRFNLSALAVRERSITLYLILLVALAGLYAFVSLGRAEDPAFTLKVMLAEAHWDGATAREMQEQVGEPLERALDNVPYFDFVETIARPGSVYLRINFEEATPPEAVNDVFYQVRKHLSDAGPQLPPGVAGPFFNDDFSDVYFTLYALTAPGVDQRTLVDAAETLRREALRVEGVDKAHLIGEQDDRVEIRLDPARIQSMGLSVESVAAAIDGQNRLTGRGLIETDGPRLYLRVGPGLDADGPETIERIAATPLTIDGRVLRVSDVAEVSRRLADPPAFMVENNGERALMVGVIMEDNVNGLALGERLSAFEERVAAGLPAGVALEKVTNQADAIRLAVDTFQIKFLLALGVVMLVGFLALGLRAGLVVALAVPLTLAVTFVVMQVTGKNLDRITLGALILSLGLLVDDAIIAIEMMLVKLEEGADRIAAAGHAWTVTAMPMLVGTLVTVVGFVPIGFAQSNVGEYAGNIFWILGISLIASWFVAVVFTPYLGVKLLPRIEPSPGEMYTGRAYRALRWLVTGCVAHRWWVVGGTLLLFAGSAVLMGQGVAKQFFPSSDRPELLIDIQLPEGSSIAATREVAERVAAAIEDDPALESLSTYIGRGAPRFFLALNPELPDPAFAKIIAVTHDAEAREALSARLETMISEGAFPEARVRPHPLLYGPPVVWPVQFRVMGPEIEELLTIGERVRAVMAENPHLVDPHLEWGRQVPTLSLSLDPARLAALGLTPVGVQEQLARLINGQVATELREGIRGIEVLVRAEPAVARDPARLESLPIRLADGSSVPLAQLGEIEVQTELPVFKRRNQTPYLNVNAEIRGAQPPDATFASWDDLAELRADLPAGYRIEIGGTVEQSGRAQDSIKVVMPLMVVLMLTLLMLNMRSFPGLFMVLLTAPLGLIGAAGALALFNQPFGFVALLGLIGLAGILMRNTLILVGQIDENRRAGDDRHTAVIEATIRRARPVVLTALAAVLAFVPLTASTFWGPLAVTLIGGIAVGTVLTIVFLPAMYAVWFRVRPPTAA